MTDNEESEDRSFGTLLRSMDPEIEKQANLIKTDVEIEKPPIPENFDGRITWSDYLTPIYDQGNCAGCYAFSTISCLSDRFALQTVLQVKPYFDPMEAIMCFVEAKDAADYTKLFNNLSDLQREETIHVSKSCKGDTLYNIASHLFRVGAVENTCMPIDHLQEALRKTGRLPICTSLEGPHQNLCLDEKIAQRNWPAHNVYTLQGEGNDLIKNIKYEIMKWGPISVAFKVFPDFIREYDGKTMYVPKPNQSSLGGHAVKIVGWGIQDNIPHWICANSWGVDWGENGYFKIVQGNKDLELENNNIGLWPLLGTINQVPTGYVGKSYIITDETLKEKDVSDVDPVTFYPREILALVKAGKLIGSLDPVIDISKVPFTTSFFAYRIGHIIFPTFGGGYKNTVVNNVSDVSNVKTNWWINGLIIVGFIVIIVLSILLWKCHRGKILSIMPPNPLY